MPFGFTLFFRLGNEMWIIHKHNSTKPPRVVQSDSSDHVTINDQHVKRQLELLMQMKCETSSSRSFAVAKVTFQKCVALGVSLILFPLLISMSHSYA